MTSPGTVFRRRTARALLDLGAVRVNARNPFIYASRKIGPVYVDVRRLASDPRRWSLVVRELTGLIRSAVPIGKVDLISGGELADLLFSIPVAVDLRKPHLAIRKMTKGYGSGGRLLGTVRKGERAVHVADLITQGRTALEWVAALREAGAIVEDYVVVFDRMQGGRAALTAQGVKLHAVVRMDASFLQLAVHQRAIREEDRPALAAYLADAEGWARAFLRRNPRFVANAIKVVERRLVRREGLEVLSRGYPDCIPDLRSFLWEVLDQRRVREAVPEVGYSPAV